MTMVDFSTCKEFLLEDFVFYIISNVRPNSMPNSLRMWFMFTSFAMPAMLWRSSFSAQCVPDFKKFLFSENSNKLERTTWKQEMRWNKWWEENNLHPDHFKRHPNEVNECLNAIYFMRAYAWWAYVIFCAN